MATFEFVYHFWVGNRTGYVFSSSKDCPRKQGERLKYMGFTSDAGWPKLMSTGRVLHKPIRTKQRKKKLSGARQTDVMLPSAIVMPPVSADKKE